MRLLLTRALGKFGTRIRESFYTRFNTTTLFEQSHIRRTTPIWWQQAGWKRSFASLIYLSWRFQAPGRPSRFRHRLASKLERACIPALSSLFAGPKTQMSSLQHQTKAFAGWICLAEAVSTMKYWMEKSSPAKWYRCLLQSPHQLTLEEGGQCLLLPLGRRSISGAKTGL